MHQFLRITEVLLNLLIDRLAYLDKFKDENSKFNPEKHQRLNILSNFFKNQCNMELIKSDNNLKEIKIKCENMMGPKKRIVLSKLTADSANINTLFDKYLPESLQIYNLWKAYYKLNVYFRFIKLYYL